MEQIHFHKNFRHEILPKMDSFLDTFLEIPKFSKKSFFRIPTYILYASVSPTELHGSLLIL